MATIRIRFNYGNVEMNEHGLRGGGSSICGNTVEVLSKSRYNERFTYGGTREYEPAPLLPIQYVKILNVMDFFPTDDLFAKGIKIGLDKYCVGIYDNDRVYLVLKDGEPMTFPLERRSKPTNNVVEFKKR